MFAGKFLWRCRTFLALVLCVEMLLLIDDVGSEWQKGTSGGVESIRIQIPRKAKQSIPFGNCVLVLGRTCPDPDVTFFLFTDLYFNEPQKIHIGNDVSSSNLSSSIFDPTKPTKIIIHGYNSDRFLGPLVEIKNQFLQYDRYMNIFMIDWSPLGQGPCYPAAVWNTRHVGKCASELVKRIREVGAEDIQVVGFSLGAHVSGFLANNLRPYKLPRISGLDPAMPGFVGVTADNKLDKTDAQFVDVLHTNAFVQGQVEECGHVDFYMNGGVTQPGCWAENRFWACNHHRAPQYFAESITTDRGFWGWPCQSFLTYLFGGCPPKEPQIVCGQWVNEDSQGMHLVLTDSVYPFAVGKYTGPAIEVAFKKSEANRLEDYERYKKDVCGGVDCDAPQEMLGVRDVEELEGVGGDFLGKPQVFNRTASSDEDYFGEELDDDGFSVVMV